ncbi:MAG: 4Fe-4S dicluster domain-containing protein, partial [Promethearchaeota archaeon]
MGILGINYEKCTKCKECIKECPSMLFRIGDEEKVIYNDPH